MIIIPQGKVTKIDGTTITGLYSVAIPSGGNGNAIPLANKELYRAKWIRITNGTDKRIVARKIGVQAISASTGIPSNYDIDKFGYEEDDNFAQLAIEVGETVYLQKRPGNTTLVTKSEGGNPAVYEDNQMDTESETYSLYQIDGAPTTGSVYVSPVSIML